jgi:hypothetical protein
MPASSARCWPDRSPSRTGAAGRAWGSRLARVAAALLLVACGAAVADPLHIAPLRAAPGQPVPHSLLGAEPIPAVLTAVAAARAAERIPARLNPASAAENNPAVYVPFRCVPRFGPGSTFDLCRLGDRTSRHVVALVGDSHAWMWIPGLVRVATELHFQLVPLTKPGCLLRDLYVDRPGWPCLTWYRRARRDLARLHPSATLVSFMTSNLPAAQAGETAAAVRQVVSAVPHGVLMADTPFYNADTSVPPQVCLAKAQATQGACARPEAAQVRATLGAIQQMAGEAHLRLVPTLQWFCADGLCPTVIDRTVTSEDGSHITSQYSELLAPLLAAALRPILGGLWLREAGS